MSKNINKQPDKNLCSFCNENSVTVPRSNLCQVCVSRAARTVNVTALYRVAGRISMIEDVLEVDTEVFDC